VPHANSLRSRQAWNLGFPVVLGELVPDHERQVDHPPTFSMPERAPTRRWPGTRRSPGLPWSRRRTHHMDLPHMRPDGVRAATQHSLHHPGRACDRAHLHPAKLNGWPRSPRVGGPTCSRGIQLVVRGGDTRLSAARSVTRGTR
jgi:hypothetical protein